MAMTIGMLWCAHSLLMLCVTLFTYHTFIFRDVDAVFTETVFGFKEHDEPS